MQQIRTILSRAITLCWRFTDSCSRTSLALGKKIWCNRGLPQSDKDESFFTDRWKIESSRNYPKISELEERFHASIDKSWFDRVTLITSVPDTDVQPCFQHGRVAYAVLSDYLKRADGPVTIFETGTARGLSSLCMVKAMQDQGKFGTVLSFDVLPHFDPIYWNSLGDQGGKRTRSDIFNEVGMDMDGYFVAISSSSKSISEVLNPQRIHFS